jgi:hypothetical protein
MQELFAPVTRSSVQYLLPLEFSSQLEHCVSTAFDHVDTRCTPLSCHSYVVVGVRLVHCLRSSGNWSHQCTGEVMVRALSHVLFFFNRGPVRRVPIPNRYTAKAKLCFCKNNKRRIIIVLAQLSWVSARSLRGSPRCALTLTINVRAPRSTLSLTHSVLVFMMSASTYPPCLRSSHCHKSTADRSLVVWPAMSEPLLPVWPE